MSTYSVWVYDGLGPERLCGAPTLAAARARWGHSRHAAIFDATGEMVDAKRGADPVRLAAIEAAYADPAAQDARRPARLPPAVATEPMPERPSAAPPESVAVAPIAAAEPAAPPIAVELVEPPRVLHVRERAERPEPTEVARLRRLVDAVTRQRNEYREQAADLQADNARLRAALERPLAAEPIVDAQAPDERLVRGLVARVGGAENLAHIVQAALDLVKGWRA